ncbi:Cysteine-rich receptor-like protein kinase 10 [Heracleum sosnowskyi]|uniref:non-specific serine/threonine protein kinase n=1 Tax=Heracleum sosnowskyi TaxID=360622 RepID=A0AAD8MY01_9APIA|nr:Cysteine-rich receptor-like protein kinase 10 [Heracleum sosnowskyi]
MLQQILVLDPGPGHQGVWSWVTSQVTVGTNEETVRPLDWPIRFKIINGIARGILYLHQNSSPRVIHRDLKASNILLDSEMNPKFSDFGLARILGESESELSTMRIVGTYGYMSPEYAMHGTFSVKSDVYSFGVLVLEIISGMNCSMFDHGFYHLNNLPSHAWRLFQGDKCLELLDKAITRSCDQSEVSRAIQVALLCVQSRPQDRPSMSMVVSMLTSDVKLPQPKQSNIFIEESDSYVNNVSQISPPTTTVFIPRMPVALHIDIGIRLNMGKWYGEFITDKNAKIGKNVVIANSKGIQEVDRASEGFYIRSGIIVVLKNSTIADGLVI